jgi:hypothetical protein
VQILLADPRSLHTCHRPDTEVLPGQPLQSNELPGDTYFQETRKYYTEIAVLQLFLPKGKQYEIAPTLAAIVTSCHSSARFARPCNMFFLSSNNSTTSTLYFLQIIELVQSVIKNNSFRANA